MVVDPAPDWNNMRENINSGYGQLFALTTGKTFVVANTSEGNYQNLAAKFVPDRDGTKRLYTNITDALAACVTGRGDKILLTQGFTTAPTLTELATANTKGVLMEQMGGKLGNDYVTLRAAATLPATTATPYFTVTGKIRLLDIIGEVTTAIQNQANNLKLIANPTVGADVDLCAVVDSANAAVGSILRITGTFANAMVIAASAATPAQASPVIVAAGTIDLSASATNTGATKWLVRYEPIDPGARVFAA